MAPKVKSRNGIITTRTCMRTGWPGGPWLKVRIMSAKRTMPSTMPAAPRTTRTTVRTGDISRTNRSSEHSTTLSRSTDSPGTTGRTRRSATGTATAPALGRRRRLRAGRPRGRRCLPRPEVEPEAGAVAVPGVKPPRPAASGTFMSCPHRLQRTVFPASVSGPLLMAPQPMQEKAIMANDRVG